MIEVSGINIVQSALNTEMRVLVLEKVIEKLLMAAPPGSVSTADVAKFRQESLAELQRKYPQAGIRPGL